MMIFRRSPIPGRFSPDISGGGPRGPSGPGPHMRPDPGDSYGTTPSAGATRDTEHVNLLRALARAVARPSLHPDAPGNHRRAFRSALVETQGHVRAPAGSGRPGEPWSALGASPEKSAAGETRRRPRRWIARRLYVSPQSRSARSSSEATVRHAVLRWKSAPTSSKSWASERASIRRGHSWPVRPQP